MYTPKHFQEDNLQELLDLMRLNPLGIIVWQSPNGMTADHVPLFYKNSKLVGHIAKANPMGKANITEPVLVIFQGANAYISPNWYPTKQEDHKSVPTWNYATVHVHGQIKLITENAGKVQILKELTAIHEATQNAPWSMDDAPADYIKKMTNGVIGLEIAISTIEGKWKVSQNQPLKNKVGVMENLQRVSGETSAKMIDYIKKRE